MNLKKDILFCFPASLKKKERDWIKQQPELQLLGNLVLCPIEWEDEITGTENEWKKIASELFGQIDNYAGIVVWAPEQSLLNLSAYLQMAFDHLSIPIILFSAPTPAKVSSKVFLQLGLKSVLINSMYLALSDLAEVFVLAGSEIYRPDQCQWIVKNGNKQVVSNSPSIASIHFQLEIHQNYHKRSSKKTQMKKIDELYNNFDYLQWYPGLQIGGRDRSKKEVVIVQTTEAYWEGNALQKKRHELLQSNRAIIWYTQDKWLEKKPKSGEYFLSHPQEWWAVLLTQFAFSGGAKRTEAFEFIKKKQYEILS